MSYFDPGVQPFFAELALHNSREWFTAHRDDYERLVRVPLERLAAEAGERYGPSRVMRPNRDVRFSADKAPYRTNGGMWAGEVGGVYTDVDADGITAGGGLHEPSRDQLQRARAAIGGRPSAAERLQQAVDRLERAGFELAGPSLRTAPRGWPRDHPRIGLLRLQHYAAVRHLPPDASRRTITAAWTAVEPLIDWARDFVGPAETTA